MMRRNTELLEFQCINDRDEMEAMPILHCKKTRSCCDAQILTAWSRMQRRFCRVLSHDTATSACNLVVAQPYRSELISTPLL